MSQTSTRRDRLRKSLRAASLDGLLVTSPTNVGYLTGFTGEDSYLLLTRRDAIVLSDPRFTTQLEEECPDLTLCIRKPGVSIVDETTRAAKASGARRLGIEAAAMTVAGWQELSDQLTATDHAVNLVPTRGLVEALREIKDKEEIEAIRGAVDIAQRAFAILRASLRPEQTEKQVADDLEHNIRLLGGQATSFPSIVAVGPRAALPHARPTDQLIGASGLVLVDWGARARRYVSDLTRVLVTSRIPPKVERIYRVVLSAQEQAIAAIRPGVSAQEVDRVAREAIAGAGFGRFFGHGLGHGIGLDVHESPRLSANQDRPLRAGMVVTVEPGIYLPGIGGVRIEDDVLVTKSGHEVLSNLPKQWDEIATA